MRGAAQRIGVAIALEKAAACFRGDRLVDVEFHRQFRIARLQQRWAGAVESPPPPGVQRVIDRVLALLNGEAIDLADVPVDLDDAPEFHRRVYEVARTIPPGKTMTYGDIAKRLGGVELSRDVGQALGRNPCPIVVPCHRVLAAGNKPGGFSANGGVVTKLKMLAIEGAVVNHTPSLFD